MVGIQGIVRTWRKSGVDCKFVQSLTSSMGGVSVGSVRTCEANAVDHTTLLIRQGPDTDVIANSFRRDGIRWNDTGSDAVAGLWSTPFGQIWHRLLHPTRKISFDQAFVLLSSLA
jgi:hypothetical protein